MKRILIGLMIAVLLTAAGCGRRTVAAGPDRFMDVAEIKPGMKGFGRTVFKGDTIEEFDVEIIGVLAGAFPDTDMILAEIHHPVTDEAGVIAGMSGSPIYIDGRLIGALAYGWSFQKRSITGITPIAAMRQAGTVPGASAAHPAAESRPVRSLAAEAADIVPLAVPLTMTGVSPAFRERMRSWFEEHFGRDFVVVAGGQGGRSAGQPIGELEEGSAVAVKLIEGAIDIAAVGTVSYIDGDTVYAFGHPFQGDGSVNLPMAKAWIHTVISSMYRSFKLSSTGDTIGRFTGDYGACIRGTRGDAPDMIPLTASVSNSSSQQSARMEFRLVRDRNWTPFLAYLSLMYLLDYSPVIDSDVSVWVDTSIEAAGLEPVTTTGFFQTSGKPMFEVVFPMWDRLDTMMDNPIKPMEITSITMNLRIDKGRQARTLVRFMPSRTKVKPGGTIDLSLVLQRYAGAEEFETLTIRVPESMPEGPAQIALYNGLFAADHILGRAPGVSRPRTVEQLAERLRDRFDANTLLIDFNTFERGLVLEGVEYEDIPESIASVYIGRGDARYTPTYFRVFERQTVKREDVAVIDITLDIDVSRYHE